MIAIDTNILLRHLLDDDKTQADIAHRIIKREDIILITDVVLAEAIWTLKGRKYRASTEDIINVINSLLAEPSIFFESIQTIWSALNDYRKARPIKISGKKKQADFADALIINKARYFAAQNDMTLAAVYTFDVAALEIHGVEKPN